MIEWQSISFVKPFSKGVKLFVAFAKCQAFFLPCTQVGSAPRLLRCMVCPQTLSLCHLRKSTRMFCRAIFFSFSHYSFFHENEVSVFKYAPSQHRTALPLLWLCAVSENLMPRCMNILHPKISPIYFLAAADPPPSCPPCPLRFGLLPCVAKNWPISTAPAVHLKLAEARIKKAWPKAAD